jgi:hypothetical protein
MVFESDPFEDFKRRRQIEMLEIKFKEKAREKQKELARLFQQGDGPEAEGLEEKVEREMLEFFDESTRHVQRLVGEFEKNRPGGQGARVQAEMDEFIRRSSQEAENLLLKLRDTSSPPEIQGRLQNLLERSVQEVQKVTRSTLPAGAEAPVPPPPQALPSPGIPVLAAPSAERPAQRPMLFPAAPLAPQPRPAVPPPPVAPAPSEEIDPAEYRALRDLLIEKGLFTLEELSQRAFRS